MKKVLLFCMLCLLICAAGCASSNFGSDVAFLRQYARPIILSDSSGRGQVAVLPALQGRVATSTADGPEGQSFGWINYDLFKSRQHQQHINAYGGEDRFWMGPEGGQYSIFFKKGVPFNFDNWFTPPELDTIAFETISTTRSNAVFRKNMELENYSGIRFKLRVDREIAVLEPEQAADLLGIKLSPNLRLVCFESRNKITNTGRDPWKKETGLLSIWILGMLNHSPSTTVVIPFVKGAEAKLGRIVNDEYFGKVPADRLVIKDDVLFFKADGQYRSKIGLSPMRAKSIIGSYDADSRVLTIVQYSKPAGITDYVNSMWEIQKEPYAGDTINSYNDGAPAPGAKPLGPFYEIESSSPAIELGSGKSITHVHRTFHIQSVGDTSVGNTRVEAASAEADLDPLVKKLLGSSLAEITTVFEQK